MRKLNFQVQVLTSKSLWLEHSKIYTTKTLQNTYFKDTPNTLLLLTSKHSLNFCHHDFIASIKCQIYQQLNRAAHPMVLRELCTVLVSDQNKENCIQVEKSTWLRRYFTQFNVNSQDMPIAMIITWSYTQDCLSDLVSLIGPARQHSSSTLFNDRESMHDSNHQLIS